MFNPLRHNHKLVNNAFCEKHYLCVKQSAMRNFILSLAFLSISLFSWSGNITMEQASQVARNFYFERGNISNRLDLNAIKTQNIRPESENVPAYYICNMLPKGFVIVSASDNVIPVLAYSFESKYADDEILKEGFKVWMNHYKEQIESAVMQNVEPADEIKAEWHRLLNPDLQIYTDLSLLQNVEPLLVSKWNQDSPYNSWCPLDPAGPGGHCYAGCVATAMGQLLYYYRFPQQGQGSYSYIHPVYGTLSADFSATTYQWNSMPSILSKMNDPVSELLFHQGVSVDMDYGPDGSGMWNHKAAYSLKTYFRYGPETQYFFRDSVSIDWDSLLVTNLDQRKPLYYAGWAGVQSTSGHAFVCDGYQPGNYYHFNWGWGGSQDGYFYTNNLTPGGSNFNFAQEVIPLFPDTVQNTYPTYCQGNTTLTSLRGSIEDGSGWYNYQNNVSCSWLIAPQDTEYDSIKNIQLTFLRFNIESGADTLYIYDGTDATAPLLGSFSGNSIPSEITSAGNKIYIEFHSNSSVTADGWQLDYESIIPVYCTGITTLTDQSGIIEDGSGNKNYNSNSLCRWKIIPSGGMPVTFHFTSFETHDSADVVKFIDLQTQEVLGIFSGNALPPDVTAASGKMLILFITNSNGNSQGWTGEYYTSGLGLNEIDTCISETMVYPNPTKGEFVVEKYLASGDELLLHIRVIDINGITVYNKKINCVFGINHISIDLTSISESIYTLIIEDGQQKETRKIVIQD
jgi:hypothetical protein